MGDITPILPIALLVILMGLVLDIAERDFLFILGQDIRATMGMVDAILMAAVITTDLGITTRREMDMAADMAVGVEEDANPQI